MANSRNEMNETLIELIYATIVQPMRMSERIILEHALLVAILHANIGSEIGKHEINLWQFVLTITSTYCSLCL